MEESKICKKDRVMNVDDLYVILWNDHKADEYELQAVAYDNYNVKSKSEKVKVRITD